MAKNPGKRTVGDIAALKALAHPRRQRILEQLSSAGPATSASLARHLDLNTGATSYHLRELARHGFVEEVPDRAHGRERWWRASSADLRFPLRSEQDPETRKVLDKLGRRAYAQDMRDFIAAQADMAPDDPWSDAFPFSRGTIRVTPEQLHAFFEDYIALLGRYWSDPADADPESRLMHTRFLAYPDPGSPGAGE
ncbi:helix-turn-helix protein [Murinocardiopsis flavida]|uniref:Helix-turn-helix protein n=1 Tax=Murinocardiopsis flavida TaxID=645275 RepID=A0A2P8DFC3_9ACTN|nr:helix-turn-helix domain-containing protein [Murinocardiopsis flavida]PSK95913.1 helix-turn-helix protein [Murinocardiopsis flavida]